MPGPGESSAATAVHPVPRPPEPGPPVRRRRSPLAVLQRTRLWTVPPACRALVLAVDALTLLLLGLSLVLLRADGSALLLSAVLLGAAGLSGALANRLGEPPDSPGVLFIALDSCWLVPAALLLPLPYVVPVALLIGTLTAQAQRRAGLNTLNSFAYAVVALSAGAAAVVGRWVLPTPFGHHVDADGPLLALGLAAVLLAFTAVNLLMVVARRLSDPQLSWREAWGEPALEAVEAAMLCLGALLTLVLDVSLALGVLALPVVLVLHRLTWLSVLRRQADRDPKTDLFNVTAWTAAAEAAVRRAVRERAPLAVLLLDLDHFKAVNDRYGHLVGDQVLAAVADLLRTRARAGSTAGRFGGEEFVLLLPGADRAAASAAAERLREAVAELVVPVGREQVRVTASVGVSAALDEGGLATLLASADVALYAAKAAGRDRVCAAPGAVRDARAGR